MNPYHALLNKWHLLIKHLKFKRLFSFSSTNIFAWSQASYRLQGTAELGSRSPPKQHSLTYSFLCSNIPGSLMLCPWCEATASLKHCVSAVRFETLLHDRHHYESTRKYSAVLQESETTMWSAFLLKCMCDEHLRTHRQNMHKEVTSAHWRLKSGSYFSLKCCWLFLMLLNIEPEHFSLEESSHAELSSWVYDHYEHLSSFYSWSPDWIEWRWLQCSPGRASPHTSQCLWLAFRELLIVTQLQPIGPI